MVPKKFQFVCQICLLVFHSEAALGEHLVFHNDDMRMRAEDYEMQTQGIQYPPGPGQTQVLDVLVSLSEFVSNEYPNLRHCLTCPKHFTTNALLRAHLETHKVELSRRTLMRLAAKAQERAIRRLPLKLARKKKVNTLTSSIY